MERRCANRHRAMIALRVALILGLAGCSNKQMSASNPFMAPDRVPPPATRTIAPGTAAPYYPGDPMPAAHVPPAPPVTPIAGQPQPPMTQPMSQPPITPVGQAAPTTAPQPLAFSNERNVAIPTDNQDLRFASPQPMQPAQPPTTPFQSPAPVQQAGGAMPATQQVIPAAYNQPIQPIASQPAPANALVPAATSEDSGVPWRSPQVPNGTSPVMQAQYVQPQQVQPNPWIQPVPQQAPTAATMPVQLQPVAAPNSVPTTTTMPQATPTQQVAPTMSSPPRMRFPSWTDPTTWFTPQPETTGPPPGHQLVGYMVPGPNGQMQMVSVEQMQAMSSGAAQSAPSVATSDGFRPRGSSTK